MADEPMSQLTQIAAPTGTPPYPTAFTNPTTGAMLEILDTTNTTMWSTGTNSKIAPGDLIKGYLAAGSNVTLTETSGIVTIAASGGGGSPGGTSGQIQYDNAGSFGGATNLNVGSSGQLNCGAISAPGSPSDGDLWYDSTELAHTFQRKGMTAAGVGTIFSQVTNVTVSAASATTLLSTTSAYGSLTLPAGFLNVAGKTLRVTCGGYWSTTTGTNNAPFIFKLGSNIVATDHGKTLTASMTNQAWFSTWLMTTKATGTSGKLDINGLKTWTAGGSVVSDSISNGTTSGTITPQTQITLDLTASYTVDCQVTWSATGNSITLSSFNLEVLN